MPTSDLGDTKRHHKKPKPKNLQHKVRITPYNNKNSITKTLTRSPNLNQWDIMRNMFISLWITESFLQRNNALYIRQSLMPLEKKYTTHLHLAKKIDRYGHFTPRSRSLFLRLTRQFYTATYRVLERNRNNLAPNGTKPFAYGDPLLLTPRGSPIPIFEDENQPEPQTPQTVLPRQALRDITNAPNRSNRFFSP